MAAFTFGQGAGRRAAMGLALAGAMGLAGCVNLGGGKAPAELIRLTPSTTLPVGATQSAKPGDVIVVTQPETDRSLAVTRVPVQVSASGIAYLKDAVWLELPARQFRALLAETLRAGGKHLVLEDTQAEGRAATVLAGKLVTMGYDAHSRSVVVRYDALRRDADGTTQMRRFEAVEKDVAPKASEVAPALNRAANDVAGQVAQWIG